jgi:hypothetical protein
MAMILCSSCGGYLKFLIRWRSIRKIMECSNCKKRVTVIARLLIAEEALRILQSSDPSPWSEMPPTAWLLKQAEVILRKDGKIA